MRVLERLDRLYAIGGGPGANRLGGSPQEDEAHELVADWMREAGLEVDVDSVGNLFGRLRGRRPKLPEVWTGSHLDSVPAGGKFDGALGVVGGIEAVERLGQQERSLVVVAFRDEEGCRGIGCFGSRSLCSGKLDPTPAAFLELHVEQGPRLSAAGAPLGVVTGIAASARGEVVFDGREGHAGTTPMDARDDALVAAAEFVLQLRERAAGVDGAVATIGRLVVEPGATNVIPGRAALSVDIRAPDEERVSRVTEVVPGRLSRVGAVAMGPGATAALRAELEARRLPVVELSSGAGHDAGVMAAAGVPAAMLFVRSGNGGISHSPEEHSADEDVALGVDVLAAALGRLASAVDK
ncbi:MAG TPA: Zn-dependent hydrolase [Gaiellaceae bacterium]|jgi:acetylornithine deacetylase/succinyl-diaminopimelate desuccinylase-like protein|nr:Zn-dependent hydrolase [Gaiellaceae bacterium]